MNGAMNGDIVEVDLIPEYLWEQSREGIVTRIISRSVEEVVGTFEKNKKFGFVVPDDRKQNDDIFIKKKDFGGAKRGDKVVARIVKYPGKHDSAEGRIIQVISHEYSDDPFAVRTVEVSDAVAVIRKTAGADCAECLDCCIEKTHSAEHQEHDFDHCEDCVNQI